MSTRETITRALAACLGTALQLAVEDVVSVGLLAVARFAIDRAAMAPETFAAMAAEAFEHEDQKASQLATQESGDPPPQRDPDALVARSTTEV